MCKTVDVPVLYVDELFLITHLIKRTEHHFGGRYLVVAHPIYTSCSEEDRVKGDRFPVQLPPPRNSKQIALNCCSKARLHSTGLQRQNVTLCLG